MDAKVRDHGGEEYEPTRKRTAFYTEGMAGGGVALGYLCSCDFLHGSRMGRMGGAACLRWHLSGLESVSDPSDLRFAGGSI